MSFTLWNFFDDKQIQRFGFVRRGRSQGEFDNLHVEIVDPIRANRVVVELLIYDVSVIE